MAEASQAQRNFLRAIFSENLNVRKQKTRGKNAVFENFTEASASRFEAKALSAYQNNLYASAIRALQISYPTLLQLSGDQFFQNLALAFLRENPFKEGDWGEWGGEFSSFIAAAPEVNDYPYFSSVAQLDWFVHQVERGRDQSVNVDSFARFAEPDVESCCLEISPLVAVLPSDFPIVDIYRAHESESTDEKKNLLRNARRKMEEGLGQTALIYRPLYKACVETLPANDAAMLNGILRGLTLAELIANLPEPEEFDFESWLAHSVERKIILGVR